MVQFLLSSKALNAFVVILYQALERADYVCHLQSSVAGSSTLPWRVAHLAITLPRKLKASKTSLGGNEIHFMFRCGSRLCRGGGGIKLRSNAPECGMACNEGGCVGSKHCKSWLLLIDLCILQRPTFDAARAASHIESTDMVSYGDHPSWILFRSMDSKDRAPWCLFANCRHRNSPFGNFA